MGFGWFSDIVTPLFSGGVSTAANAIAPQWTNATNSGLSLGWSDLLHGNYVGKGLSEQTDTAMGTENFLGSGRGLNQGGIKAADLAALIYGVGSGYSAFSSAGDVTADAGSAGASMDMPDSAYNQPSDPYSGAANTSYDPSYADSGEIGRDFSYDIGGRELSTAPEFNDYGFGTSTGADWTSSTPESYGINTEGQSLGVDTSTGGDSNWLEDWWNKPGGKGIGKLPMGMAAMGMLSNMMSSQRENKAVANSLDDYFKQKWTPESRGAMMEGVMGEGAAAEAAARRKAGAHGAASGRGGGMYGSSAERAAEATRESAATALSKTYAPTNFDANAYIAQAKAQQGSNWWDSLLNTTSKTGGMWPYVAMMQNMGG